MKEKKVEKMERNKKRSIRRSQRRRRMRGDEGEGKAPALCLKLCYYMLHFGSTVLCHTNNVSKRPWNTHNAL